MLVNLPANYEAFSTLGWPDIEQHCQALQARPLSPESIHEWLSDWTALAELIDETLTRFYVATTLDTTDEAAEKRYLEYLDKVMTPWRSAEQRLREKLLASGIEPAGFAIPLRNMRAAAELFREANLPLFNEESRLGTEYSKIIGAQTVDWDGEELTLTQLVPFLQSPDRALRERAFRAAAARRLQDRESLDALWVKFLDVRRQIAANADMPDMRAYAWKSKLRFDYTPDDNLRFLDSIEAVVVPAAARLLERYRQQMGVDVLRPWDADWRVTIDPLNRPPLKPYRSTDELEERSGAIFHRVDPGLGAFFDTMRREHLLDLDNRKGKAPGGYCTYFANAKRPFIFMNGVGSHDDVQTMLHEAGHCFHAFETSKLPYYQQAEVTMEFAEVASMAMELLAAPYLTHDQGGFYTPAEAARARVDHLTKLIRFWCYMAVVDGFQHWVYTHLEDAKDPRQTSAKWVELWQRFMPVEDWTGLEPVLESYWHRQLHIFELPFYYVEYGLAQLGAVQIWRNALTDQAGAVASYRRALALGGTVTLPELFQTAGARFAFDAATLRDAVSLIEETVERLEQVH